jgi:Hint domain
MPDLDSSIFTSLSDPAGTSASPGTPGSANLGDVITVSAQWSVSLPPGGSTGPLTITESLGPGVIPAADVTNISNGGSYEAGFLVWTVPAEPGPGKVAGSRGEVDFGNFTAQVTVPSDYGSGQIVATANIDAPPGDTNSADNTSSATMDIVCFASGTLIRTVRGEVAVENLVIGDRVVTSSGEHRPITWLGHRTIDCRNHPRPDDVRPVRIAAHAFGANRPARDLMVSPGHALCVDLLGEVFVKAGALVNGATIARAPLDKVTYWHVELESHDVLLAENLPAESYLPASNRAFFVENGVVAISATPDGDASQQASAGYCRPLYDSEGVVLDAARALLRARAIALGWRLEAASAADLRLEVDGAILEPVIVGNRARFLLPAEAAEVRLLSPTSVPAHLGQSHDRRTLGADLLQLTIDDGLTDRRIIPLDDARLDEGFADFEGPHRWTTGRAKLPASLWAECAGSFFITVTRAGGLPYWVAPSEAGSAAHIDPLPIAV